MNEITVFVYFICFGAICGATFAFTWRMMTLTFDEFNGIKKIHPELEEIKPGEKLLVFKVEEEED
tara:strand:- start:719 stop:913 length:195 start_codon:yes stop_codon:yes gene_type:complete